MLISKTPGPISSATLLLLLGMFLLPGCDHRSRHQTLTFFFTGVPSLEEGATTGEKKAEPEQKSPPPPAVILSAHKFFVERKCAKCHLVTKPIGAGRGADSPSFSRTGPAGPADPPRPSLAGELGICIHCHSNPFAAEAPSGGRRHAPVACTICHLPHQSEYPHLLRDEVPKVCIICHQHEKLAAAGFHKAPLRSDHAE